MDDMAEYRRRHREAYLKRIGREVKEPESNSKEVEVEEIGKNRGKESSVSSKQPVSQEIEDYGQDLFSDEELLSEKSKRDRYKAKNDDDYEASLELAKKLQREFDSMDREVDGMDNVRNPDPSYKECLLSSVGGGAHHDPGEDMDLQRAIAKSLVDM